MISVKIHTEESPRPLPTAVKTNDNLEPKHFKGVAHLFRQFTTGAAPVLSTAQKTRLFVVAVPNYMTEDEFMVFCGDDILHFRAIVFLRNDAVEGWYSVLIRFKTEFDACEFYRNYNGKTFRLREVEVCHIYFAQYVEHTDSEEIASMVPEEIANYTYTALPSCPACLESIDPDTSGIPRRDDSQSSCISKWTLSCPVCRLCYKQKEELICAVCETDKNLSICLICGVVGCGSYEKGHASEHQRDKQHHFWLELKKQQVPDECNRLLASQLDPQRQHYESLIAEAKSRRGASIEEAVAKAISSMTDDMRDKLEKCSEEKKAAPNKNQELMKEEDVLQSKYKEIAERERSLLKSKDDSILQLGEQFPAATHEKLVDLFGRLKKQDVNTLTILVMGKGGVGKSSTVNSILGERVVTASAFQVQSETPRPVMVSRSRLGFTLNIIDTSGLVEGGNNVNTQTLDMLKRFLLNKTVDVLLYVDRLDSYRVDNLDKQIVESITDNFGKNIWHKAVVVLTHAQLSPPDALSYEEFFTKRSESLLKCVRQGAKIDRKDAKNFAIPVALVENSGSCNKNEQDEKILPTKIPWIPNLVGMITDVALNGEKGILVDKKLIKGRNTDGRGKIFIFLILAFGIPVFLCHRTNSTVDQGRHSLRRADIAYETKPSWA